MSMISEAWGSGFIYQKNDEVSEWRYTRGKNPNVIATNTTENFKKHSKTIQTAHTEKLEHPFWISPFQRHKLFSRREKWLPIHNHCMRTDIILRDTFLCRKVVPQKISSITSFSWLTKCKHAKPKELYMYYMYTMRQFGAGVNVVPKKS